MLTVMKFGGSILSTAEDLRRAAGIIKARSKERKVVVVSALKGVTDSLIGAGKSALQKEPNTQQYCSELKGMHLQLLGAIKDPIIRANSKDLIEEKMAGLERALLGVHYLGEMSPKALDLVQTFGERLSAVVVAAFLNDEGEKSVSVEAHEAGLFTDGCFGKARTTEKAEAEIRGKLLHLLKQKKTVVITGFFGADEQGNICCFGRGGSDYSAGIIAAALGADRLELWKDVPGFYSADPKTVKKAVLLKELSYDEAEEIGYFGAKILHPKTIAPVRKKGIPVVVKNVLTPGIDGTIVTAANKKSEKVIKAISSKTGIIAVTVKSAEMATTPGVLAKIFAPIAEAGIEVDFVSTSETSVSFTIDKKEKDKAMQALQSLGNCFDMLSVEEGIALVAAIGEGMKPSVDITGKVFGALAKEGINVEMISQGASEINLSLIIKEKDLAKAINALHAAIV
ncbi:MAG: aspartate kinase [Candidatus Diapherotrites archaeon]|nr:aspartate kinase [Candidatus Diapherotrites archaeon]